MELKDFKDVVRVMTKEEFESTIEEDIKFVEGFKNFLKHDDATRIVEHIEDSRAYQVCVRSISRLLLS